MQVRGVYFKGDHPPRSALLGHRCFTGSERSVLLKGSSRCSDTSSRPGFAFTPTPTMLAASAMQMAALRRAIPCPECHRSSHSKSPPSPAAWGPSCIAACPLCTREGGRWVPQRLHREQHSPRAWGGLDPAWSVHPSSPCPAPARLSGRTQAMSAHCSLPGFNCQSN